MKISVFKGMIPQIDDKLIDISNASYAENCRLNSGKVESMNKPLDILCNGSETILKEGTIKTIYKNLNTWLYWNDDVDVVPSFVPDGSGIIYYTGDGYPKITDSDLSVGGTPDTFPKASRKLGLSKPDNVLSASVSVVVADGELYDSVSYVYTRVNRFGQESAPSPATDVVDVKTGESISLTGFVCPDLAISGEDIVAYRVYRTVSTSYDAELRWVHYPNTPEEDYLVPGDMPVSATEFVDYNSDQRTIKNASESFLQTEGWLPPPAGMKGLISHVMGVVAGFKGQTVFVSEIMAPYAFPEDYKKYVDSKIIALASLPNSILVLTKDYPWLINGSTPATMIQQKINYPQGCVSSRGVVSTPMGVFYPSPDGLCHCDGETVTVVTRQLISQKQWQALNPAGFYAFYHEGEYIAFNRYSNIGIIIDLKNDFSLRHFRLPALINCGFYDSEADQLVLAKSIETVCSLCAWDKSAEKLDAIWRSKRFSFSEKINIGAAQLEGDFENIVFSTLTANELTEDYFPESSDPFWLSSYMTGKEWVFNMSFKGRVDSLSFGISMSDLEV